MLSLLNPDIVTPRLSSLLKSTRDEFHLPYYDHTVLCSGVGDNQAMLVSSVVTYLMKSVADEKDQEATYLPAVPNLSGISPYLCLIPIHLVVDATLSQESVISLWLSTSP